MSDTRSTTGTQPDGSSSVAEALASAPFVRMRVAPDADSIAAAGVLVDGLDAVGVPFHARAIDPIAVDVDEDHPPAEDDTVDVYVGPLAYGGSIDTLAVLRTETPASATAFEIVQSLGVEPDPIRTLAGSFAAGGVDSAPGAARSLVEEQEAIVRRPGVSIATRDLTDGLAHATLFHAPFSGDEAATTSLLAALDLPAEPDRDAWTRLASRVSLAVTDRTTVDSPARSAESIGSALYPYATVEHPFATIGGFADVLATLAPAYPGMALAIGLSPASDGIRSNGLERWRSIATGAHAAIESGHTGRYDGLFVLRAALDDPKTLPTIARLARTSISPEPIVVAIEGSPIDGRQHAAVYSDGPIDAVEALRSAATSIDGNAAGSETAAVARIDTESDRSSDLIAALREAIA